ncbi:hypothetical protein I4U23_005623 [Adineta vaga]|nr:hypothetical protein I4U23_005623 [Adineta vaga]
MACLIITIGVLAFIVSGGNSMNCPNRQWIEESLNKSHIPGAVIVVINATHTLYEQGFGYQSLSPPQMMDVEKSIFSVASISKTFIATAVMQLVEEERVDLDADINQYLSESRYCIFHPKYPSHSITLRKLLSHSASIAVDEYLQLSLYRPGDVAFEQSTLADTLLPNVNWNSSHWLPKPPGSVTFYSNDGSSLAGLVVERMTNMSYDRYVKEKILQPLNIDINKIVVGGGLIPYYGQDATNNSEETSPIKVGLSWYWQTLSDGRRYIGHTGSLPGALHWMLVNEKHNLGMIILTNGDGNVPSDRSKEIHQLFQNIIKHLESVGVKEEEIPTPSRCTVEGNAAANHFRQDNKLQDFDYMIEIGRLYSDEQILPVRNAPGFVMVKWADDDETAYLPHDDGFVNGFQIKKLYAEYVREQGLLLGSRSDTKPESASYGLHMNPITLHRLFSEQVQPELSSMDLDLVPSLKLEFWPHNMQWFLERLKRNRPLLFEKIEPLHMHIVPKWSGQAIGKEMRKTLRFRYSYSLIEIKLAEQR